MKTTGLISALALAAAISAGHVAAQEVHTIVPHYPDAFKSETTRISDDSQTANGQHSTTHTQIVYRQDVQKTATGYQATYTAVSADVDSHDANGNPTPQAEQQKRMLTMMVGIGSAQVTLDNQMAPLSVDNIDDMKPKIKQGLTGTGDATKDAAGVKLYDAFIANLTPQSAAAFLKQAHDAGQMFGHPLTVHVAVPITGDSVQLMGGTFKLSGTITLDDWVEGKTARITTVIAPSEADLHTFLSGMMKTVLDRMATDSNAQTKDIVEKMVAQMHMSMTETCHTTIDLSNFIANRNECDSVTSMNLDLAKALPPEMVKAAPKLAQLPPITVTQTQKSVTETRLLQ